MVENLGGGGIGAMGVIGIDIQRERDVGLGTLNQTRRALGLEPFDSFADLTPDPILQKYLQAVYGNIDNVDLFEGGMAEVHAPGARVGPTFPAIIARQFDALRAGDRFLWMNEGVNYATASIIANTTLADIILRNTDTTALQANVFIETPLTITITQSATP